MFVEGLCRCLPSECLAGASVQCTRDRREFFDAVSTEVGALHRRGLPADDCSRVEVDSEGHVDETPPGRHVGEIGHPAVIRIRRGEVAVEQATGLFGVLGGDRGADLAAPHQPVHAFGSHE